MQFSGPFIHKSNYLHHLIMVKQLSAVQILDWRDQVKIWLHTLWHTNRKDTYKWGDCSTPIFVNDTMIHLPAQLFFAHEEDLLAFKLRWL